MNKLRSLLATSSVSLIIVMASVYGQPLWAASKLDQSDYAALLEQYVNSGQVDYKGLKSEEARLDAYLDQLARIDPERLSNNEQFAFYTNAYNAWTLKLILKHYPGISSIKDIGGFFSSPWKRDIARINGETVTLDHIEHEILRPRFKDPRVHFAINCAALSCPPLAETPFEADNLDQQLDTLTRQFINNADRNYLDGNILWVSRIFKWFGEDFDDGIESFFRNYAQGDLKEQLQAREGKIQVKYLDYDWSLNGR